jgi:hypothetical protein
MTRGRSESMLKSSTHAAPSTWGRSLVGIVAIIAACSALAACGSSGPKPHDPTNRAAASNAGSASGVAGSTVAFLFPRDGADLELGSQVLDFAGAIQIKAVDGCLAARAFPPEEAPPTDEYTYGAPQMPNLPVIRARDSLGLTAGVRTPPPPTNGMSAAEVNAYDAATAHCNKTAAPKWAFGSPAAESLSNAWGNIASRITSTPAMQASLKKAASCSASTAFPANGIGQEWAAIGRKVTTEIVGHRLAAANQTQRQGVAVLIRCFGPAIELQGQLLASRRATFLATNALGVRQIQAATSTQISQVGRRFHHAYRES